MILENKPDLDYNTFAGSGEPTLSLSISLLIRYLKSNYSIYKITVLTNGTLCSLPEVRHDILPADLIISTVPAVNQ